jgi:hypothetical protein
MWTNILLYMIICHSVGGGNESDDSDGSLPELLQGDPSAPLLEGEEEQYELSEQVRQRKAIDLS